MSKFTDRVDVTVIVLARNEEKNIGDCLQSAIDHLYPQEMIVLNDNSTDRTAEIAAAKGARAVNHPLEGNWGQQQTFGISITKTTWIYFLDADERISPALGEELRKVVAKGEKALYRSSRLNHFLGKAVHHSGWFPDYGVRFIPTEGCYVTGYVHPHIHGPYPEKNLAKNAPVIHYTYVSFEQYLDKLNRYTTLGAQKAYDSGKRCHVWDLLLHPLWGIFKIYFIQLGFLDGVTGVMLACCHFSSVFMKYAKLYQLQKEKGGL